MKGNGMESTAISSTKLVFQLSQKQNRTGELIGFVCLLSTD
jgi:hypothetical protein